MSQAVFKEPMPIGPKAQQSYYVTCLSTSQRLHGAMRLRTLLLHTRSDDLMWHVTVPNIRRLSNDFLEATEPRQSPSQPSTSSFASFITTQPDSRATKRICLSTGQTTPATQDEQAETSPQAAPSTVNLLRDGQLLPRRTVQQAMRDTLSLYRTLNGKRKRESSRVSSGERSEKYLKSEKDSDAKIRPSASRSGDVWGSKATFLSLSCEIHRKIIHSLDLLDVIHLGLTCRYFLRILARQLRLLATRNLGIWAGQSIICVGEVTEENDFPPEIHNDASLREIFEPHQNKFSDMDHPTLLEFVRDCDTVLPASVPTFARCGFLSSKAFDDEFYKLPVPVIEEMIDRLCPAMGDFYPVDVGWTLRNLTTKEYVTIEASSINRSFMHGPQSDYLGFGDVMLSRSCWSTKPPVGLKLLHDMPIHRGIWAGHRFEIVSLSTHLLEIKLDNRAGTEKRWRNVTRAVRKELANLWSRECGRQWKKIMFRRTDR